MSGNESFFSRWSKRKQEAAPPAPVKSELNKPEIVPVAVTATAATVPAAAGPEKSTAPASTPERTPAAAEQALPAIDSLTPQSDFTAFMKPDVDPATRNQAMKALFRDPQFNVMDMMDVYVDDYSQPDPIPASMLRAMTQSKMLNLFDDDPEETKPAMAGEPAALPDSGHSQPAETVEVAAELGQKTPDATNCPETVSATESQSQQPLPE